MFKLVLAFSAGVGVGLWLAKQYAKNEVRTTIHDALGKVGLGGGTIEDLAQDVAARVVDG